MSELIACYGGPPDLPRPAHPDLTPLDPLPFKLPRQFEPVQPLPRILTVEKVRDMSDAERRGLVKLLPFVESALDDGAKLDREQIAAFVLLQSLAQESKP